MFDRFSQKNRQLVTPAYLRNQCIPGKTICHKIPRETYLSET